MCVVETILKKLDLEDILKKEMVKWCQTSTINLPNMDVDEISTLNMHPKLSDNLLNNKISATIQNIKINKQKTLYASQISNKEIKKSTTISLKVKKIRDNLFEQNDAEEVLNIESNEEDIFINSSRKNINSISFKSSLTPLSSDVPNDSNVKENNNTPSHKPLDTGQLARLKLNAFKYSKKSISSPNSGQVETNTDKLSSIPKQSNFSNIFSTEDEEDLSYLDID